MPSGYSNGKDGINSNITLSVVDFLPKMTKRIGKYT